MSQRIVPVFGNFPSKFSIVIFVENIKYPRATYYTIVPSTEELYCFYACVTFKATLYRNIVVHVLHVVHVAFNLNDMVIAPSPSILIYTNVEHL